MVKDDRPKLEECRRRGSTSELKVAALSIEKPRVYKPSFVMKNLAALQKSNHERRSNSVSTWGDSKNQTKFSIMSTLRHSDLEPDQMAEASIQSHLFSNMSPLPSQIKNRLRRVSNTSPKVFDFRRTSTQQTECKIEAHNISEVKSDMKLEVGTNLG